MFVKFMDRMFGSLQQTKDQSSVLIKRQRNGVKFHAKTTDEPWSLHSLYFIELGLDLFLDADIFCSLWVCM